MHSLVCAAGQVKRQVRNSLGHFGIHFGIRFIWIENDENGRRENGYPRDINAIVDLCVTVRF